MEHNRKRVAKRLASGLMAGALALGGLAISGSGPAGALPIEEDADQRISGENRYETSAEVAATVEDETVATNTVIVANGENFPDALAAASLTNANSPILLVQANAIPSSVRDRMNRIADTADDVLIIGGTAAVSDEVLSEIEDIFDDSDVTRIAGDDRYATAAAVAAEVGYESMVLIVSGQSWADAVTVGSYASDNDVPILLANSSGLPDATSAALEDALDEGVTRAIIVGGTSVVGGSAEEQLVELGFDPAGISRIAGSDRYQTNLLFNVDQFADAFARYLDAAEAQDLLGKHMMLVSGANFPDALTAAPLAAALNAHLILVNPNGGGSSWVTLALVAGSPVYNDSAALSAQFAAAYDGAQASDPSYVGGDLWIVGGEGAVPESAVSAGTSAAAGSLACSVIAAGANVENTDGPLSFVIAWAGDLSGSLSDGILNSGEEQVIDTDADMEDLVEVNGDAADISSTTLLDLDNSGNPDAVLVVLNAELAEDDEIEFLGWETDAEEYADANGTTVDLVPGGDPELYGFNGTFLRDFTSCSTEVAEDEDAPTVSISATVGDDGAWIEFSEPLSDVQDSAAWQEDLEDDIDADEGTYDPTCNDVDNKATSFYCDFAADVADTDAFTIGDDETFYDAAGNELAEADASYDDDSVEGSPQIDSASMTCVNMGAGLDRAAAWDAAYAPAGTAAGDAAAIVKIPFVGGDLDITHGSGLTGVSANEWTFTVTHERGLLLPEVAVDGTDVTITIDRYVHSENDVARAINNQFRNGVTQTWEATGGTTSLIDIDEDPLDFAFSAENSGGTEQTQSCTLTVVLDQPANVTIDDVSATPSTNGEVRVTIDGVSQTVTWQYAGGHAGGNVIEGMIWGTTNTGTAKVSVFLRDFNETEPGVLDTVTIS